MGAPYRCATLREKSGGYVPPLWAFNRQGLYETSKGFVNCLARQGGYGGAIVLGSARAACRLPGSARAGWKLAQASHAQRTAAPLELLYGI
jgi:hypothetical protein